jgi:hypothetical protein
MSKLLPWPKDAVMIVASKKGEEHREWMESVVAASCRDCGAELAADSATIRAAMQGEFRFGRPVQFFCIPCHTRHDVRQINVLVDHRGGVRRDAVRQ